MREVGIGVAGFGTVGGGVLSILRRHQREIEARLGARIAVRRVLLRDVEKARAVDVERGVMTTRLQDLLDDPNIEVVVELIGGTGEAFELVRGALERGKHVVTANKALLAARGEELFRIAAEKGVDVYYEGAVCGGVPVIRTLREALASDRITALHGIVNGTTNYILTAMAEKGEPLSKALAEAQRLGYAEADPTLDVSGGDAAQKLCVLAQLAFGTRLKPHDEIRCGYYLRFSVKDVPGVLARIAQTLARRRISIAAVQQREQNEEGGAVPLVIVSHLAREADVQAAISEIDRYDTTFARTRLIRIEAL